MVTRSSDDGVARLWNLAQLTAIPTLGSFTDRISGMQFSSDGRYLEISGGEKGAQLLDLTNLDKPLLVLTDTTRMGLSRSGRYFIEGSNHAIRLWAPSQLSAPLAVLSDTDRVNFSPDAIQ
jgi:hypothetical protein